MQAVPHGPNFGRQSQRDDHIINRQRADGVKEAFKFAWTGYQKHALPHDELRPVSNGYSDSRLVPWEMA